MTNDKRGAGGNATATAGMQAAYRDYVDARCMPTPSGKYSDAAVQAMQRAMLDALCAPGPLPEEMREHLAFAFDHLCEGIAFDLLTPVKRPGGREPPIAKLCQGGAIRYLRWCEDGRIVDASPVRTVAGAYDVAARTVRGWRTAWAAQPTPPLHEDYGAEQVGKFMRIEGSAYRRFIKKPKARRKP